MININWEDLIRPVYCVYTTTTDGVKGAFVGVFESYQKAWEGAAEKGNWGTRGIIETEKGIVCGDDVFVLMFKNEPWMKMGEDMHKKKLAKLNKTLDKLTPEEIRDLGIDPEELKRQKNPIETPLNPS